MTAQFTVSAYMFLNKAYNDLHGELTMAGFDKSLDQEQFSESVEFQRSRITVAVFLYNHGTPKVQISRENKTTAGEYSFAKLGRMTKEEVEKVIPLLEKAKGYL